MNIEVTKEMEEYCLESLSENCSFKAVNYNGNIVGAAINRVIGRPASLWPEVTASSQEPSGANTDDLTEDCTNKKLDALKRMLEYVDSQFNMLKAYPHLDRYFDGWALSVDRNYRHRGIAEMLVARSQEFVVENQIPFYHVAASNLYTRKAYGKYGFKVAFQMDFADYKTNGKVLVIPAHPHKTLYILVKAF